MKVFGYKGGSGGKEEMMGNTVNENDWKLFRSKVPEWQEEYMDKLNHEYIALLSEEGFFASEKFWELWGRIRKDRKDAGVSMEMTRSKMEQNLLSMLMEGAITLDDLKDFSDELQEKMQLMMRSYEDLNEDDPQ